MAINDRENARKRIIRWKKRLITSAQISRHVGLHESIVSRLYSGNGNVSQASIDSVLTAKEPTI